MSVDHLVSPSWEERLSARRGRVRELLGAGKSPGEISRELDVSMQSVANDVRWLRLNERSEEALAIVRRREEVARLLKSDKSLDEICEELQVSRPVLVHDIRWVRLREKPRGFDTPTPPTPPPPARSLPPPRTSRRRSPRVGVGERENTHRRGGLLAATIQKLRGEIDAQLGVQGRDRASLPTTTNRDHVHTAEVDAAGNGVTLPDQTGHAHVVQELYLRPASGHHHELALPRRAT